jgi:hypothetical protein
MLPLARLQIAQLYWANRFPDEFIDLKSKQGRYAPNLPFATFAHRNSKPGMILLHVGYFNIYRSCLLAV